MAKPVFTARSKVAGTNPPRWVTIGVAFRADFNGRGGLSVQLNAVPFNWDGNFILKPVDEVPEEPRD